jgi:hypothetical protein
MLSRKKVAPQIVLVCMNTFCAQCTAEIEASQIKHVSFNEIRRSWRKISSRHRSGGGKIELP